MEVKIRKFNKNDTTEVISMMKTFYSSNAVSTNGSTEIFEADFLNCTNENPYLEGYIFYSGKDILGYSMVAKSFSTEFGKTCIMLEDLYVKENFRGRGVISKFFEYIENKYKNCIFKLEVEKENSHALYVYKKRGFKTLPYIEMKK